ncbi:MAG: ABC transporter substrate-binding protein [Acutalibacteraceae bacterium]|jgi:oligopeptide transport system substrate-binding protein
MKKIKGAVAVVLALAMVLALAACGPNEVVDDRLAKDVYAEFDATNWSEESSKVYEANLGEYNEYYQKAKQTDNIAERWALMAIAEAKIMESAVMLPTTTQGGAYAVSRVVPKTINSTLWGNDSDRFHNALVATEILTPDVRDAVKAKWVELAGTGTFEKWAKEYVTSKGYKLKDTYTIAYTSDPQTWDALGTSRTADSEAIVNTYDGLMEYDMENVQKPALAESYDVSDDGLTYTFHLRKGVTWVDSQGRKIADVVADDFVAAMQHMMDAAEGLEYLVGSDGCNIKGADDYMEGKGKFEDVGVKALDESTVQYTLAAPCSFFTTMLGYNVFAPMSRTYYTSQGGKFGDEYAADAATYLYGKDPDHIAYCGPYLVTNATEKNTIVFKANPAYWNKDNINIKTLTWKFDDGKEEVRPYNNAISGEIDGTPLNTSSIEQAKKDGNFDKYAYVSDTNATSYMGFFNVNRKAFANFNDATVAVSTKTVSDVTRATLAMQNVHFRRAVATSIDRGTYNAQSRGEELKFTNMRNSYTPGTFVQLPEDVTVKINDKDMTFKAGTFYGEIMQAQIDADEVKITVWDPTKDGGIGSSDGFDGWFNADYAKSEMELAVKELGKEITVSAEKPIKLDIPYFAGSPIYTNRAQAIKQSIESVLEGKVIINLVECAAIEDWYNAGYYPNHGYEMNADFMDVSGWGPDYGDPQTYLDTMLPDGAGYMVKSIGMF